MTRVLAIDDDRQLLRALQITLAARGYEVVPATTGAAALAAASSSPPDVVILDLGLPDLDGVAVIEGLRGWCTAPVIVLSARQEERAKVRALDAGADDYVTKPFGMEELLARLRAAVRTHRMAATRSARPPLREPHYPRSTPTTGVGPKVWHRDQLPSSAYR